jgi:hypothetical protein
MPVRLNVNQRHSQSQQNTFSQWLYQAIAEPGVRLKVRLRGNNLHILYQDQSQPDAATVRGRLKQALKSHTQVVQQLTQAREQPIYKIILYGLKIGETKPDWIESIVLHQLIPQSHLKQGKGNTRTEIGLEPDSCPDLARQGKSRTTHQLSPRAVAQHLSEALSSLGVSVKVFRQTLPPVGETLPQQRLIVFCYCNYPPELSLLAQPIAKQLRGLHLPYKNALICAQVTGEEKPEWLVKVDLTNPKTMLQNWACWGDLGAIAQLSRSAIAQRLNQTLAEAEITVRTVLKEQTLHIFCAQGNATAPPQESTVEAIQTQLQSLNPQGIKDATLYGVTDAQGETVTWLDRIELPEAKAVTPLTLAKQGNLKALSFLLQRLVNPDLETWLETGGVNLQMRQEEDILHIVSESITCPSQGQIVQPIETLLRELLIEGIAGVRLYGRRAGQGSPQWSYGVDFVSRKGQAQTPPELVKGEDVSALVHLPPEGDTLESPDHKTTEKSLKDTLIDSIISLACQSRLFVRADQTQTLARQDSQTFSAYQGVKVALVWSVLGLLLAIQADWVVGRLLKLQPTMATQNLLISPSDAYSEEELELSDFSLQKTDDSEFNRTEFTAESESATARAILATARAENPTFNNRILDEKLALYQEQIIRRGVPDVLILGSSRAMRGVDPDVLETALAQAGHGELEIYNFGVNGATAQVVDLIVRQLLPPEQLPKLIIWADGARAFNSGRPDLTYSAIATSPGYEQLEAGSFPNNNADTPRFRDLTPETIENWLNNQLGQLSATYPQRDQLKDALRVQWKSWFPASPTLPTYVDVEADLLDDAEIELDGFLPISKRFQPSIYYKTHPKVAGAYDSDYATFDLEGEQDEALNNVLDYLQQQQVELVFVNTPLTDEYLDKVRRRYEREFQTYMRGKVPQHNLIFRDLSRKWVQEYNYFSDPSHLNRYGAYHVSLALAKDVMIPWESLNND